MDMGIVAQSQRRMKYQEADNLEILKEIQNLN